MPVKYVHVIWTCNLAYRSPALACMGGFYVQPNVPYFATFLICVASFIKSAIKMKCISNLSGLVDTNQ